MSTDRTVRLLRPDAAPTWLARLVDNVGDVPAGCRERVPADVVAAFAAANTTAGATGAKRDAAVLVLFSGPRESESADPPDDADLLVTVRSSDLRDHAGQAAFPGGAIDPGDDGPVAAALREANEETGLDPDRIQVLAALEPMFIPPSGFHVVPVLAYSPDPGPVGVVDPREAAIVARVPVRAFVNPENRLMVYRRQHNSRFAGPAFLLNQMLVWGFTGQVISAILDVAGWARDWNTDDVRDLDEAMTLVGEASGYREGRQ